MNLARGSREPQLRLRLFSFVALALGIGCASTRAPASVVPTPEPDEGVPAAPQPTEDTPPKTAASAAAPSASVGGQGGGGRGWGTIGLARVGGPPSHEGDVARSLERQRAEWTACRAGVGLLDTITLRLTIDRRGRVLTASALETTLPESETACVVRTVRGMALPPSQRASHTVEVPLSFSAAVTPQANVPEAPTPPREPTEPGYAGAIQRAMRAQRGEFRGCFEASLRCCPNLSAQIVVSFTVKEDGRVEAPREVSSDGVTAETVGCVLDAVRALSLPVPPNGRIKVRYPIPFGL